MTPDQKATSKTSKRFSEFKKALETKEGRTLSDDTIQKSIDFLELLAKITVGNLFKEAERKQRLVMFPKGFHVEESCTCPICGESVRGENSWYDKDGAKCMTCQAAINKRIIPRSLLKQKDSFYTELELGTYFNLKGKLLNEFIRKGYLKTRVIPSLNKGNHLRVFLLKNNKDFLPPKKLLSSHLVRDDRNGKEEYVSMPWHHFHDPKVHLKNYQISQFLSIVSDLEK